jgi:membrane protease YdiL (CAAX protease family)
VFGLVEGLSALFPVLFSEIMESYHAEGVGLAFAVFQVGPLTAFAEEILFRGIVLGGLRRTFPDGAAIAVSAAMFATIHLSPVAFIHTGALGLVFGWLTVRTSSLWPAILLHTAWNTTMVLIAA